MDGLSGAVESPMAQTVAPGTAPIPTERYLPGHS
jgi:hypothetical protein